MHDLLTHGFSDRQVPETEIIRYFTSQRCVAQMWTNTDAWNMQSFHQNEVNRSSSVRVLTMEAEMHNKFKKKNRNRHIPETQLKCHLAIIIIIIINTLKFIVHVQCMSLVLFVYLFAKSIIRKGGDGEFLYQSTAFFVKCCLQMYSNSEIHTPYHKRCWKFNSSNVERLTFMPWFFFLYSTYST